MNRNLIKNDKNQNNTSIKDLELQLQSIEKEIIDAINDPNPNADKIATLRKEQTELIQQVAKQITNLSRKLFCAMPDTEFAELKDKKCPNFLKFTELFKVLVYYVQLSIMQHDSIKERILALERWIKIMRNCYGQNDINSLSAIFGALNSPNISQLYSTNDSVLNSLSAEDEAIMKSLSKDVRAIEMLQKQMLEDGKQIIPLLAPFRKDLTNEDEKKNNTDDLVKDLVEIKTLIENIQDEDQIDELKAIKTVVTKLIPVKLEGVDFKKISSQLDAIKEPINGKVVKDIFMNSGFNVLNDDFISKLTNRASEYKAKYNVIVEKQLQLKRNQEALIEKSQTNTELSVDDLKSELSKHTNIEAYEKFLYEMKKTKEPKGVYTANDLLQREKEINFIHDKIKRDEYSALILNDYIRMLVEKGLIKFLSNDKNEILKVINNINEIAKNKPVKGLFMQFLNKHFTISNIKDIDLKKIIRINKQIYYHQLLLNPVLAKMINNTYLKSKFDPLHPFRKTGKLIKKINKTIEDGDDDSLQNLLKNIGFETSEEQLKLIKAENVRLRQTINDRSFLAETRNKWLAFNRQMQSIGYYHASLDKKINTSKQDTKVDASAGVKKAVVNDVSISKPSAVDDKAKKLATKASNEKINSENNSLSAVAVDVTQENNKTDLDPNEKLKRILNAVKQARVEKKQPMWRDMQSGGNVKDILETLKNNMRYYEQIKYPHPPYTNLFANVDLGNGKQPVHYVSYDGSPLSNDQLEEMRKNTLKLRRLSFIGGFLYIMSESLPSTLAKHKDAVQTYLIELANQVNREVNQDQNINEWLIKMITGIAESAKVSPFEIQDIVRLSERYFVAEYKSQQILVNVTATKENEKVVQRVVQMDLPLGNFLTESQKRYYHSIYSKAKPEWFTKLTSWEQGWLETKIPKNFYDTKKWEEFTKLSKSSAMANIVGVENARMNHLFVQQVEKPLSLYSQSVKTSVLVPYEMPGDHVSETYLTVQQVLEKLTKQSQINFDKLWNGSKPDGLKPLVFMQSLLSDSIIGFDDKKNTKLQLEMIEEAKGNYPQYDILAGNDTVNFQRWVVAQSGAVSRALGRWDYTDAILDYAEKVIEKLNLLQSHQSLTDYQKTKLGIINSAVYELKKLRTNHNLPQFERNYNAFKASYTAILVEALGGIVSTNCKSGKDRTGFDELYRNAMMVYYAKYNKLPSYADSKEEHKKFIDCYELLFNSRKVHEAAAGNTPGSFGMIDEAMMLKFGDIAKQLGESYAVSDKLARLNKPKGLKAKELAKQMKRKDKLSKSTDKKQNGSWHFPHLPSLPHFPFFKKSQQDKPSMPIQDVQPIIEKTGALINSLNGNQILEQTHVQNDLKQLKNIRHELVKNLQDVANGKVKDTMVMQTNKINEILNNAKRKSENATELKKQNEAKQNQDKQILQELSDVYTTVYNSNMSPGQWVARGRVLTKGMIGNLIINSCYHPETFKEVLHIIAKGREQSDQNAIKAADLFKDLITFDSKLKKSLQEAYHPSIVNKLETDFVQGLKTLLQVVPLASLVQPNNVKLQGKANNAR